MSDIRAQVLGAPCRPDTGEFLVQRLSGEETEFHRFVGGGIHRGERSSDAVEREFREELAVEVSAGPVLCTVENLFTDDGTHQHELVVVRDVAFEEPALYDRERFQGVDAGGDVEYEAYWRSLSTLESAEEPFYPAGIESVLAEANGQGVGHLVSPLGRPE